MEPELPDIIRVKVVVKSKVKSSLWGPNTKLFLQCDITF